MSNKELSVAAPANSTRSTTSPCTPSRCACLARAMASRWTSPIKTSVLIQAPAATGCLKCCWTDKRGSHNPPGLVVQLCRMPCGVSAACLIRYMALSVVIGAKRPARPTVNAAVSSHPDAVHMKNDDFFMLSNRFNIMMTLTI